MVWNCVVKCVLCFSFEKLNAATPEKTGQSRPAMNCKSARMKTSQHENAQLLIFNCLSTTFVDNLIFQSPF